MTILFNNFLILSSLILIIYAVHFDKNVVFASSPKEAYFNGSAYIRLLTPMPVWSHSAISFRTCRGGEIFSQQYNKHTLSMSVAADSIKISLVGPNAKIRAEAEIHTNYLDNRWHTVQLIYRGGILNLLVDRKSLVIANSTYNTAFLTNQEVKNEAAVLILGKTYSGCLLHGPGLMFNVSTIHPQGVLFGPCPLAVGICGKGNDILIRNAVDHCVNDPCLQHGVCVSSQDSYECHCTARFTGKNCQIDQGNPCLKEPCSHGGSCIEEKNGNYQCTCLPSFTGIHCEREISVQQICEVNPCQNNGSCKAIPNGRQESTKYECECIKGFSGTNCEIDENECEAHPCVNGKCIDQSGGYLCDCTGSGYTGSNCQTNIDECEHNICQNGGSCFDTYGSYICLCEQNFEGLNCEKIIKDCQCSSDFDCIDGNCICRPGSAGCETSSMALQTDKVDSCSCSNGGTCFNGTHCNCPAGYNGARCEKIEIDANVPCSSSPCLHGATCKNKGNKYECICPEGWNGTNCDADINECEQAGTCGHGLCVNNPGGFKCYCEPGFTGLRCASDVDECLSHPCKNGATCINKINDYECFCPPGFTEKDCSIDIDECASNPCSLGSTCKDMIDDFACICVPGMTGRLCNIDIDDCASNPCQHNGLCIDKLGGFKCDCTNTGYIGKFCELNINECLSNPCQNGGTCEDKINDYSCNCFNGYSGKNCQIDIDECQPNPCQYNSTCLERSNLTLYNSSIKNLPSFFYQPFSHENAAGYECICVKGTNGTNCEQNFDECASNPCSKHGVCNDGIGTYTCDCEPGYEGAQCEINIDECGRYEPCVRGSCVDLINDYLCDCDSSYGGKNCSVLLTGCSNSPCLNNGTCKPYLVNETEHLFNCTCKHGYQGDICQKTTTMSLVASSLITVNTTREEGYDITLEFKTTLPNGILAFGKALTNSYILELINGRLNLHSSLLNKWEGVFIGSGLNDSNWQKVFVTINSSHLVLSANQEQTIYPINSYESTNGSQPTTFPTTYLGGTIPNLSSYLRHLTHQPSSFVGCMQDVVINGKWIFPEEPVEDTSLVKIESGCPRTEQCKKNPCHSNGMCKDLWRTFSCDCQRPHLGKTCKFNITAATFGNENTTHSVAVVDASDIGRRAVRSILDISMFIRTRHPNGMVFYIGKDLNGTNPNDNEPSYVSARLSSGELLVKMQFNRTTEAYTVGGNKLDNGYNHLIQIIRNQTLVQVKVNGTEYFRKTLSSTGLLDSQVLYLGGLVPIKENSQLYKEEEDIDKLYFKGIIQDVQISNGSYSMAVELYPLNEEDLVVPSPFGEVKFDEESILKGEISDDLCRKMPCQHNAECKNTWNDFLCICPKGYKGKLCQDIQFCELNKCPGNGTCQNLDDGFECITNMTFQGIENNPLSYVYHSKETAEHVRPIIEISYRTKTGGTLFYVQDGDRYFEIGVFKGQVTVLWRLSPDFPETRRFNKANLEEQFGWNTVYVRCQDGKLEGGWKGWEHSEFSTPDFSVKVDQNALGELLSGKFLIYLGGMPLQENSTKTIDSGAIFKGCLGEARVGNMLLPFFEHSELYSENIQLRSQFLLNSSKPNEGCILCFQNDCKNNGKCSNPSEKYACDCLPGYDGDDCSQNIDECLLENQCQNNSTCIDQIAHYICECLPGFEGVFCEKEIDECASHPCHNGGNCSDLIAGFECKCTDEYAGVQCDVLKLVTCENNPCKNGTCVDGFNKTTGNNFTCDCMPGMEGILCDTAFCFNKHCENGGFCLTVDHMPPICQCSIGYEGKFCETDINECASNPCENGGKCTDEIGKFICNCTGTGFEGSTCEIDIDECSTRFIDCGGKGVCMNTRGSFKCHCEEGLCGPHCSHKDLCTYGNICQNNGVCVENCVDYPDYICKCTDSFTGKNCSEPVQLEEGGPFPTDIAIIVVPVVIILIIICGALLSAFIIMARNKRATRGTYSPSAQEYCNPRLEMDSVLKPPPEERLI